MAKYKSKKLSKKLLHKYRLIILNEDTFEELLALNLTRLNVFVLLGISSILLIGFTILFISFTPLKEYIPGYSSSKLKKEALALNFKTDSLQQIITNNDKYYASIKKVLKGEVNALQINKDSILEIAKIDESSIDLNPTKQDSVLRAKVDKEDKYSLFETAKSKVNFLLFPPVNGKISEPYNVEQKHYAVDIIVAKNTPVKATADGRVIFAEWTAATGFVSIIEHSHGLISVYKHNASLTKYQGDLVKAGEVIATSGNTGELTTGPHLHFELWSDGYAVNPTNFIDFK